jgi:hypothetical protein
MRKFNRMNTLTRVLDPFDAQATRIEDDAGCVDLVRIDRSLQLSMSVRLQPDCKLPRRCRNAQTGSKCDGVFATVTPIRGFLARRD